MSFSHSPLELHFDFTVSFKREALRRACEANHQNQYNFVKSSVISALAYVENRYRDDCCSKRVQRVVLELNPDCWYIMKVGETGDRVFFYVFGIKLTLVCSSDVYLYYARSASNAKFFIKCYYHGQVNREIVLEDDPEADGDGLVVNHSYGLPKQFEQTFEILESFRACVDSLREIEDGERDEKLVRRRYYECGEIGRYIAVMDENKLNGKPTGEARRFLLEDHLEKNYF